MASNTITNILDKILAAGLMTLREQAVMPRLVTSEYGDEAAMKGQTIDVPVPKARSARNVSPAPTHSSATAASPGLVQIQLNQWKHDDLFLTDKQMVELDRDRHFIPMEANEIVRALANAMDGHVHAQYTGIYGYVGTAGVTPFSTVAAATNIRKVLNEQLAPIGMRHVVLDPTAEAQALQLAAFSDFEKTGDRDVKIEGELGRKFGMDWFMSQNVVTHTAGTLVHGVAGSAQAAGTSSFYVKSTSATGNVLVGDVFTIAGDATTYTVNATVSAIASSAGKALSIDPALAVIASTQVITFKRTHVVNLAFHPNAFAFATRPLISEVGDFAVNPMRSEVDPMTNLALRVEVIRQNKQTAVDYDVLYGAKLVRPQLATRIAG